MQTLIGRQYGSAAFIDVKAIALGVASFLTIHEEADL